MTAPSRSTACRWVLFASLSAMGSPGCPDGTSPASGDGSAGADAAGSETFDGPGADAVPTDLPGPPDAGADAAVSPETDMAAPDAPGRDAPEATDAQPGPPFCLGPTSQRYAPFASPEPGVLPDDALTVDDPASVTGLRVRLDPETVPWLDSLDPAVRSIWDGLDGLSGWGTSAPVVLSFDAPLGEVPSGPGASVTNRSVRLVDLGAVPPTRVPFEAQTTDEGRTLMLWPLVPLTPAHLHGVVVTTDQPAADGGCVAPSAALRDLLLGRAEEPRLSRLHERYAALLDATGLAPEQVSAAGVFTTQGIYEDSLAVAADVAKRSFAWSDPPGGPSCSNSGATIRCERAFVAGDYRRPDGTIAATPQATWEIPVSVWLPAAGTPPYPVLVAAHGINATRSVGGSFASRLADVGGGVAVVAIDALYHGAHPTAEGGSMYAAALGILGVDAMNLTVDGRGMRDNFRQSTYDRLQLVELLTQHPDGDGDGAPDLDPGRLAFGGVSLGAMMGGEQLAISDRIGAAILLTAGGRLISVMSDGTYVDVLLGFIKDLAGSEGGMWRMFWALQTTVEAGDAVNYAPRVLGQRLVGDESPDLLATMALGDAIIPNSCSRALTRALGAPVLEPVLQDVGLVPVETAPAQGNVAGGSATAAMFQYDRVSGGGGSVPVTHDNLPSSQEATVQLRSFIGAWLEGGPALVVDPYAELGTPPLAP